MAGLVDAMKEYFEWYGATNVKIVMRGSIGKHDSNGNGLASLKSNGKVQLGLIIGMAQSLGIPDAFQARS